MRTKFMNFYVFEHLFPAAAFFLLIALSGAPALSATEDSEGPALRDLTVIERQGRLLVFATLEDAFPPDVREAVHGGVTTRFTFEMAMMRPRTLIFDQVLFTRKLIREVKYDALKKAYTFRAKMDAGDRTRKITSSHDEMVDLMTEINGESIVLVRDLDVNGRFYLRARASMDSVRFAFPFNYLLAFLGKSTEWANSTEFGSRGM